MRFSLSPVDPVVGDDILSLAEAKAHLRVLHGQEDALIGSLRDAAVDMVEQFTGQSLQARSHKWVGSFGCKIVLGVRPLVSIEQVKYLDANGVQQTASPISSIVRQTVDDELLPPVGGSFPVTAEGDGAVEIVFNAGYAEGECPPSLIAAVKMMLGTLYANREAVVVGVSAEELPLGFVRMCQPYRKLRV